MTTIILDMAETSEADKTDAKDDDDDDDDDNEMYIENIDDLDDDVWDLFDKVHTMHKERESIDNRSRISTMGGFVVNKTTLLKLHIDESNYLTIPIKSDTKAIDAINKIITRRKIPSSTNVKLYQDGQEIDDNANLYEIMQISSSGNNRIQVRFKLNDNNNNNNINDHHLIDSFVSNNNNNNKRNNQRRRAFPNKMNLVAFNKFSIQESDDNDIARDQVLQNIENSLKQLPRQQFNVIKINRYNNHQKRILKLTQHGIENIKPGKKSRFSSKEESVTSFHLWENITNSYLEDSKTIRISYRDYKDGDRKYQSEQANNINESIQKRLKIIREQKTNAGRKEISIKFQKKLINQQITNNKIFNINDHVRLIRNRSGYIIYKGYVHFAPGQHYGIKLDENNGDHNGFYKGIRYFKTNNDKNGIIVPESHIIRKIKIKIKSKLTKQIDDNSSYSVSSPWNNGFLSNKDNENRSIEDTIYKELKIMILSSDTREGRYRENFASKFYKYTKEENLLEMVRDFMDAVKEKIQETHGSKYKQLILNEWHKFQDNQEKTENDKANELSKLSDTINALIESAIEQTILQAKIKEIYKICLDKTQSETQILSLKIDKLRHRHQQYFGIKKELQSTTNWNRAIYELSLMKDCTLPSEKINTLVNCAHAIYLSHSKEQREKNKVKDDDDITKDKKKREEYFITGDDFLPIVIFVIINASKSAPCITDADLLFMELIDPAQNRSEPGYYLAVFHAALQWIRCFNN